MLQAVVAAAAFGVKLQNTSAAERYAMTHHLLQQMANKTVLYQNHKKD